MAAPVKPQSLGNHFIDFPVRAALIHGFHHLIDDIEIGSGLAERKVGLLKGRAGRKNQIRRISRLSS